MKQNGRKSILVVPSFSYSFNEADGSDGVTPVKIALGTYEAFQPFDKNKTTTISVPVATPGIGCNTYRITRVDRRGVWGYLLRSTVRILTPEEVR